MKRPLLAAKRSFGKTHPSAKGLNRCCGSRGYCGERAAGLVRGLAFSQRRTLVERAVTSHLWPSTSFKMISERLTIRCLRALFSSSKVFDANSIDVLSSELSGQSVGEFRSGVVETRECGINTPVAGRERRCSQSPIWPRRTVRRCISIHRGRPIRWSALIDLK
jgi:hypothetical protein